MFDNVRARLRGYIRAHLDLPLLPHHILTDVGTDAVLAVGNRAAPITVLQILIPDTKAVAAANYPNYPYYFPLDNTAPAEYPSWTYTRARTLVRTHPEVLDSRLRELSALAMAKHDVLTKIIRNIDFIRSRNATVLLQEHIYLKKQQEAETFRANGYDESDVLAYPYLLQYAEFADTPLRAAADEILLKAKLEEDRLAKTELLRMKFFNRVRDAKTLAELSPIEDDFLRDVFPYYGA